ncbi:MAG: hypothetical protein L6R37_005827 [Teloschistes peruensis]|nr:MAG: hypothetical protein L6R37_005827 [Teloschistes peruensis]
MKLSTVSDPRPSISESLHRSVDDISPLDSAGANARTYANGEGKSIFEDLHDFKERLKHVESRVTALETENKSQNTRLELLELDSLRYYAIRRRFIDVFKRDHLDATVFRHPPGNDMINFRDEIAHDADVVADALLFEYDKRPDGYTFRRLYGLDLRHVLKLVCKCQIPYSIQNLTLVYFTDRMDLNDGITDSLNDYANLIVMQKLRSPTKRDAYRAFIHAVENNRLSDPATNLEMRIAIQDYYSAP